MRWKVEYLEPEETDKVNALAEAIGFKAAARHLEIGKNPMAKAMGGCCLTVAVVSAIRARIDVPPPSREELRALLLERLRQASARRWSKPEEREKARRKRLQQESLRRRRLRSRLKLIRQRAVALGLARA